MSCVRNFIRGDRGAVTLDWIVLTGVIALTGLSILGGVSGGFSSALSGGVETASVDTSMGLRGEVTRRAFGSDACPGGTDGLRARETARVADGGFDAVDVTAVLDEMEALSDAALRAETLRRSRDMVGGVWTRDHTLAQAAQCVAAARGLE